MACFGPTRPGRTGHPLAGQQLTVFIPEVLILPSPGNTGARGRGIVARLDTGHGHTVRLARFTRLRLAPVRSADDARSFSPRVLGQFPRPVW
jgi:hypothetical protein